MSRLIDADKLKKELKVNDLGYQYYMLDNAPTINAIPVEWVIELSNRLKNDEDDFEKAMFLLDLVGLWEKENEERIMSDM